MFGIGEADRKALKMRSENLEEGEILKLLQGHTEPLKDSGFDL